MIYAIIYIYIFYVCSTILQETMTKCKLGTLKQRDTTFVCLPFVRNFISVNDSVMRAQALCENYIVARG